MNKTQQFKLHRGVVYCKDNVLEYIILAGVLNKLAAKYIFFFIKLPLLLSDFQLTHLSLTFPHVEYPKSTFIHLNFSIDPLLLPIFSLYLVAFASLQETII